MNVFCKIMVICQKLKIVNNCGFFKVIFRHLHFLKYKANQYTRPQAYFNDMLDNFRHISSNIFSFFVLFLSFCSFLFMF